MSDEQPTLDRMIVKIIRALCLAKDIDFTSYSYDWILSLQKNNITRYIYGYRFDLNNTAAGLISQDKVATYQVLAHAGIPAVPHTLVSSHQVIYENAWKKDAHDWRQLLLKPTNGAGGRNIYLFEDIDATKQFIDRHQGELWSASPFLPIVKETRIVVLDNEILLSFEKHSPVMRHGIPMFNLRLGARAVNITPAPNYIELARRAQQALGLHFVAVDIIELASGEIMVLETNDGFSLEHYMAQDPENIKRATAVYEAAIDTMMMN